MGIFDTENLYDDDDLLLATSRASTNVINHFLNVADVALNLEGPQIMQPHVYVQVTEAFAGGTSLLVELEQDDVIGFGGAEVLASSGVIVLADLVVGKVLLDVSRVRVSQKYTRLNHTIVGTMTETASVGSKLLGGLTFPVQHGVPSGFIA